MIVPRNCWRLLREQRTHLKYPEEYGADIQTDFDSFAPLLPDDVNSILDIGCGMAGIDVLLHRKYPDAQIILADKQGVSGKINSGFHQSAERFSHYHDFSAAMALLAANGVPLERITTVDLNRQPLPNGPFDVVVSLLSWGFHYPVQTYSPRARAIIIDVRKGTEPHYTDFKIVADTPKYQRIVVTP